MEKTTGELGIMIENMNENMEKHIDANTGTHEILFSELKETNGRESGLEKWRYIMVGGLTVLTTLLVPVILMFIREALR